MTLNILYYSDSDSVAIDTNLSHSKGKHEILICVSKKRKWTYTLQKLLVMVYTDDYCANWQKRLKQYYSILKSRTS